MVVVVIAILVVWGYGKIVVAAVRCAGRFSAACGCCAGAVVVEIAIPAVAVSAVVVIT